MVSPSRPRRGVPRRVLVVSERGAVKKDTKMALEKISEIRMNIIGPCSSPYNGPAAMVSSIEELREHTFRFTSPVPYTIKLARIEYTIDTDRFVENKCGILGQWHSIKSHPIVKDTQTGEYWKTIGTLKIFVGDHYANLGNFVDFFDKQYGLTKENKLFLKENHGLDLDFCDKDKKSPVALDKVKYRFIMIPDTKTGTSILKMVPLLQFHYLTDDGDIFVTRNLFNKTKKLPQQLIEFFNQNTNK